VTEGEKVVFFTLSNCSYICRCLILLEKYVGDKLDNKALGLKLKRAQFLDISRISYESKNDVHFLPQYVLVVLIVSATLV